jgi:serine/threonine-protein kinase HipA
MTSEPTLSNEAYVWVWLPEASEPVVAGVLTRQGARFVFNYGRSYSGPP